VVGGGGGWGEGRGCREEKSGWEGEGVMDKRAETYFMLSIF
jgi:hypothetical protein